MQVFSPWPSLKCSKRGLSNRLAWTLIFCGFQWRGPKTLSFAVCFAKADLGDATFESFTHHLPRFETGKWLLNSVVVPKSKNINTTKKQNTSRAIKPISRRCSKKPLRCQKKLFGAPLMLTQNDYPKQNPKTKTCRLSLKGFVVRVRVVLFYL